MAKLSRDNRLISLCENPELKLTRLLGIDLYVVKGCLDWVDGFPFRLILPRLDFADLGRDLGVVDTLLGFLVAQDSSNLQLTTQDRGNFMIRRLKWLPKCTLIAFLHEVETDLFVGAVVPLESPFGVGLQKDVEKTVTTPGVWHHNNAFQRFPRRVKKPPSECRRLAESKDLRGRVTSYFHRGTGWAMPLRLGDQVERAGFHLRQSKASVGIRDRL